MDIIATILEITIQPTTISHIIARAYLNYLRGKGYIDKLLQLGLLERRDTKYVITEKGEEFLLYYQRIRALLGERAPSELAVGQPGGETRTERVGGEREK